ncbi:MAG: acylneuraminate cytidylyltransferase [Candidatus Schekmanbacteria bacterium RBG_16_38_10]|uniref:Acylneuraminate cytidylyltransferase n=1 Tax=Candidatus Schekmanbacteria bacterium RBG_16_38_10 TaxID=1817879 RepID=A0A1F7RZ54_9BACT|nr:MAG: acylneuraminate cytidylyltransferase [Candidatus Schekmanbacteria bacterium RBG_16_38_10]
MRKLVACLACRNQGTRLYGKPLQNLDIEKRLTVLEYMIASVRTYGVVSDIILGISEGPDNIVFKDVANRNGVDFIVGSEEDVLQRLIQCCEKVNGTDIFRLTTESPFTYFEAIDKAWDEHVGESRALTALDHLPDGSGFEIISLEAYKRSWERGQRKHRSELCSLYIRENKNEFNIGYVEVPQEIRRRDIRLTIDYPEDLVLCRAVYQELKNYAPRIPLKQIIDFIDSNPQLKAFVDPYVEGGLKTMYL